MMCISEKKYDESTFSNVSMNLYEHHCPITFTVYKNNTPFQYLYLCLCLWNTWSI